MNHSEQELLTTGAAVSFNVLETHVNACATSEEVYSKATLMILDEDDDKGYETTEWGAFGFIYLLASLSFNDAAPRNTSEIDYQETDYFTSNDLVECLSFTRGTLRFYSDYLRGRLVKTEIIVHQDGRVDISTVCRGNALQAWLRQLQGKQTLQAV